MTNQTDRMVQAIQKNDEKSLQELLHNNRGIADAAPGLVHSAAASGNPKLMELLLQNGANVDAFITGNGTPLKTAALAGNYKVMEMLIRHGADVDHIQYDGLTTLAVLIAHQNRRAANIGGSRDLRVLMPKGSHSLEKSSKILIQAGATFPEGASTSFSYLETYQDKLYKEIGRQYTLQGEENIRNKLRELFSSGKTNAGLLDSLVQKSRDTIRFLTGKQGGASPSTQPADVREEQDMYFKNR